MNYLPNTIDVSKIQALIYHFPDGKMIKMVIKDIKQLSVLELEIGKLCDNTDIDGSLHFYPRGNT